MTFSNLQYKGRFGLVIAATLIAALLAVGVFGYLYDRRESPTVVMSGSAPCALSDESIARIKAASVGELRAFAVMDRPYSVAQFRFNDSNGNPKTIADWQGRTVLVNLWATWCAPCRAEMPLLDQLQGELGSDEFEVLPISVDKSDPAKPKGFFNDIAVKKMGFFHDRESMTLSQLKRDGLALGLPATLLVDSRGCAVGRLNGPAEWASEDAHNLIKSAL